MLGNPIYINCFLLFKKHESYGNVYFKSKDWIFEENKSRVHNTKETMTQDKTKLEKTFLGVLNAGLSIDFDLVYSN